MNTITKTDFLKLTDSEKAKILKELILHDVKFNDNENQTIPELEEEEEL